MKIRSLYFPLAEDFANAGWTRSACNELVDEGNNVFSVNCCGDRVEYHFNSDFTAVMIVIDGHAGSEKPVQVTFED